MLFWNLTYPVYTHLLERPSLSEFTQHLTKQYPKPIYIPTRNERAVDIILTRIKTSVSSSLKADFYSENIVSDPFGTLGPYMEDAEHFFLACSNYTNERQQLMSSLPNHLRINLELILDGYKFLSPETSMSVLLTVITYIKQTRRFDSKILIRNMHRDYLRVTDILIDLNNIFILFSLFLPDGS